MRTITDIDILAFRFPSGLPTAAVGGKRMPQGLDVRELDGGLGIPADAIDMIIGEVKEGRVGINMGTRDPEVLKVVIGRLGDSGPDTDRVVEELLHAGATRLPSGVNMRLIAFGAFPPGAPVPPCRIISLGHVLDFLQSYVHKHWRLLRHLQFKDPALGFLMTLEKARRGHAGRRGEEGVELVVSPEQRRRHPPDRPVHRRRHR